MGAGVTLTLMVPCSRAHSRASRTPTRATCCGWSWHVAASKSPDDHGGGGGGGRSSSRSAGGGGGGVGSSEGGLLLAAALGSTNLPEIKGEDGHARVVPLPKGMLPTAQAELLVDLRG